MRVAVGPQPAFFLLESSLSVKADNDRAGYRKTKTPKRFTTRTGKQTILHERQDIEFLAQLPSKSFIDRLLRPFEQIGIPDRAVIQRECRGSTNHVFWAIDFGQNTR